MRKVTRFMPMEFTLPERYTIELHLNGEKSFLRVLEFYPQDLPEGILDRTLEMGKAMIGSQTGVGLRKLSDTEILLEVIGSEDMVINSLLGEMDMLRSYLFPIPKPEGQPVITMKEV